MDCFTQMGKTMFCSKDKAEPLTVLITGAAGQIGYALAPQICRGAMFGPGQKVILHLLDIAPAATALEGVVMELIDAAFPLLAGVKGFTDQNEACKGVQYACLVGGFPRGPGMERKEVMGKNVSIYKGIANSLVEHSAPDVKIVVVANPANTNSLILSENAPSIPKENITCLTRLDHNRALGQISQRLEVPVTAVKNVIIWGNHSSTQYPDVNHAVVNGKPVREAVNDNEWLDGPFMEIVQKRGAAIIQARKLSSALSAASSVCDHIRNWVQDTPADEWVSMGVISDGSYGIPEGLMYSFPVHCKGGKFTIVQGLSIDENSRKLMDATAAELAEEKTMALECLKESS